VRATSVPGLGSKFEFMLPVGPVQLPAVVANALAAPMPAPTLPAGTPVSPAAAVAAGGQHDEYPNGR